MRRLIEFQRDFGKFTRALTFYSLKVQSFISEMCIEVMGIKSVKKHIHVVGVKCKLGRVMCNKGLTDKW